MLWNEVKDQVSEQSNNFAESAKNYVQQAGAGVQYYLQKAGIGVQYYQKKLEDAFSREETLEIAEQKYGSTICFERITGDGYTIFERSTGEVLNQPTGNIQDPPQDEDPLDYCLEEYSLLGYDAQQSSPTHIDEL